MPGHTVKEPVVLVTEPSRASRRMTRSRRVPRSSFLGVSLEIRDMIYKMLLTTPYCTDIDDEERIMRFHLHTAIILVNKQISTESTRVLNDENHFIIFEVDTTMIIRLSEIPTFRWLPEDKMKSPLLRVVVNAADRILHHRESTDTCITTSNGLQSVISAIWGVARDDGLFATGYSLSHADLKVTLEFKLGAPARYSYFSNLVLKPWENVSGIKALNLSGDIQLPMAQHLRRYMLQGPFPSEVPETLEQYRLLAEGEYQRQDYGAARWRWTVVCGYWHYLYRLRPHHGGGHLMVLPGNGLWEALRVSLPSQVEAILGLRRIDLRLSNYQNLVITNDAVPNWRDMDFDWDTVAFDFNYKFPFSLEAKLNMSVALTKTALGKPEAGLDHLYNAAYFLNQIGRYKGKSQWDILKELKIAVNNVLIERKSFWRCGRKWPLSTRRQSGRGWEVTEGGRSYWDWLDDSDDGPESSDVA